MLRGRAGKFATVHASWTEYKGYRFEIEVYGTRGLIRVSCFPMITEVVTVESPGQRARRKRHLFPLVHILEHIRSYRWVVTRSFEEELGAFRDAIRGATTPLASGHDGRVAVEIAAAAASDAGEVPIGRPTPDARPSSAEASTMTRNHSR